MFPLSGSRKLTGLSIGIGACVAVTGLAMFAIPMLHIGEAFFGQVFATIATLTGSHQAAQATADRSQNYQNWYPQGAPPAGGLNVATPPGAPAATPPNPNPGRLATMVDRLAPMAIWAGAMGMVCLIWLA